MTRGGHENCPTAFSPAPATIARPHYAQRCGSGGINRLPFVEAQRWVFLRRRNPPVDQAFIINIDDDPEND